MRRYFIATVLLLWSSLACADPLLSNMQLCSLSGNTCTWLLMSSLPTITQKNALDESGELFFTFKNDQTFTPPAGDTWTLGIALSWNGSSVSRSIPSSGDGVTTYGIAFDMGIPDTTLFPPPPARTLFTLQTSMTDQSGSVLDSATNNFYLERSDTVPESSALLLLCAGLVGAAGFQRFVCKVEPQNCHRFKSSSGSNPLPNQR